MSDAWTWQAGKVVLVARDAPWSEAALAAIADGQAEVFVEAPVPPVIQELVGVTESIAGERFGVVNPTSAELRAVSARYTTLVGGRLAEPTRRGIDRADDLDWTRLDVPIAPDQARAWGQPAWDVARWRVEDSEVLADWHATDGSRWPAIVRRGRITAAAFSLLTFIGQRHTVEPFDGAEWRSYGRSTGIEALLLGVVDIMHRRAGATRARMLPWPGGSTWGLNIRHDFDRDLNADEVDTVLARHGNSGTSATWYWRARHLLEGDETRAKGTTALRRVAERPRHEVALHTEGLYAGSETEKAVIERAARHRVRGASAHGDPRCFRWQGAPNVLWAEQEGLDYTEFISHAHLQPHRFAALRPDGSIEALNVICMPHHESFDTGTGESEHAAERMPAASEIYRESAGFMQVLNHPDIHQDALFGALEEIPSAGRLDLTAAEVADWWRRTHVSGELTLHWERGALCARSQRAVHGALVELLRPDGQVERCALNLDPGDEAVVDRSDQPVLRTWNEGLRHAFADAVRSYYGRAAGARTASVESTVRTNSELVPARAEQTDTYVAALSSAGQMAGRVVLEVGCGFGALAAAFRVERDAARVIAVDIREDFVDAARDAIAGSAVGEVTYECDDMRTLASVADETIDVAVLNNALVYVTGTDDLRATLRSLNRVLKPGGVVLLHHANRWRWRDPFDDRRAVHLLSRRLARLAMRLRHRDTAPIERVRLMSVPELARMLRRGGFKRVRAGALRQSRVRRGVYPRIARYYAVAARKPD